MHRLQPTGLLIILWMGILPLLGQTYTPVASILEWNNARNQPALYLQWVEATGVVVAHPAIEEKMGPQQYILYDSTGALRIFNTGSSYEPVTGDSVSVNGLVGQRDGLAALVQRETKVLGKGKVPQPTETTRLNDSVLYHVVRIPGVYMEEVERWGYKYGLNLISATDTFRVFGSEHCSVSAPFSRFTIQGVCSRSKLNTGGYDYHLIVTDSIPFTILNPAPAIRFQQNRARVFSNQSGAISLVLDKPLQRNGWVKIRLTNSETVQYGPDGDYLTNPEPEGGMITLTIPKKTSQVAFEVSVFEHGSEIGVNQFVTCEIVETSPGLETIKESGILIKIH